MNINDVIGNQVSRSTQQWAPAPMAESEGMTRNGAFIAKQYNSTDGLYWGSPGTAAALEPGFYEPLYTPQLGPALRKMAISTDDLIRLPDPTCDMLLKEFVDFWGGAERIKARGLNVKRGLLLWGPPGSGKTSALQLMAHHMTKEMGGIVVMANDPHVTAAALALIRSIEPARPIITLFEDLDAMVSRYGEPGILALLDGELQISGVVNVATTNYPEYLDPRFVDRPGRFDRIAFVGMPEAAARRAYFEAKAPDVAEERRERWIDASDGWSLAHLRELVVAHLALGEPDDEVIARMNEMRADRPKSDDVPGREFGFRQGDARELRALARRAGVMIGGVGRG